MVDQFTAARAKKLLSDWKQRNGRDISRSELLAQGFFEQAIDDMVKSGFLVKYQVTAKGGRAENRFKLATDWLALNQ